MAERVCPVWAGYLLASPVRKLFQNPKKILAPYVENGMKVFRYWLCNGFLQFAPCTDYRIERESHMCGCAREDD